MGLIKYSACFFIAGALPIPIIFIVHEGFPSSSILTTLYMLAEGHARAISEKYLVVSTIASAWTLLAPAIGILPILTAGKKMQPVYDMNRDIKKMLKAFFYMLILEAMTGTISYWGIQDLSISSARLQVIAGNSFLLCSYYIASYLAFYGLGLLAAFISLTLLNAIKNKMRA